MKIQRYEYQKILVESKEITLPTEDVYFFITGDRKSIKLTPIYTNWLIDMGEKEEQLYEYHVTSVGLSEETIIETFNLSVFGNNLSEHYYSTKQHSREDRLRNRIAIELVEGIEHPRTKEQFDSDFECALNKIKR